MERRSGTFPRRGPRAHASTHARRLLDGPLTGADQARSAGRCARCGARYPSRAPIRWLPGSGPVHDQCAPAGPDPALMRAAEVIAGYAADAGELAELLEMVGLIAPRDADRRVS